MEKVELKVLGMNCPHCENRVVTRVNALEGVKFCEASYKKKKVVVEFDGSITNLDAIKEEIKDAGYQIK